MGVIIGIILLVIAVILLRKQLFNIILEPEQEYYIRNLHPKFQRDFRKFITRVEKETDYNIIITSGYRTFAKQQELHEEDSRNPKPGYSLHNYGGAIDINATNVANYLRKSSSKKDWENSGIPAIARDMGFAWGGDFVSYYDPVHIGFDRTYDINKLRDLAINQYGNNWNDIKGNKIKFA